MPNREAWGWIHNDMGCMGASGVGNLAIIEGILDKYKYMQILKDNLMRSVKKLGLERNFHF